MAEVTLGGRAFTVVDFDRRTAMQDAYLQKMLRATGIDKVMPMDGEGDVEYLIRLQVALQDSMRQFDLMAAFLVPAGKSNADFSVDMARSTAKHLAGVSGEDELEAINQLAYDGVLRFFRRGVVRYLSFRKSLEQSQSGSDETRTAPTAST